MKIDRMSGLLLHVTSLPSKYGVGTLGQAAYDWIDWLESAGVHCWQVLPLVPTNYGDSPYQSVSSTALNYYLIDLDVLKEKGLLKTSEIEQNEFFYDARHTDYQLLFQKKIPLLRVAFSRFNVQEQSFLKFVQKRDYHDFAVFMVLKARYQYQPWFLWPKKDARYSEELETEIVKQEHDEYLFWLWTQYEFLEEWTKLHDYAKRKQILIMGDMPLYVAYDSVEVWKHPELFLLTEDHQLKLVAGCPPDAFTEDGQLWGNPVYDWDYMKETNYEWWNERIKRSLSLYDLLRIDHFRGFDQFYAIPAEDKNARYGQWLDGPKFDLFKDKKNLPIIAEDLGLIDDGVRLLMAQTGYPGMKVLEFAFDGRPDNEHKPSCYHENCVVYTGTHDNMPLYQYVLDLSPIALADLLNDLKQECKPLHVRVHDKTYRGITQTIVELAFASKAKLCILPMQDLLGQDGSSRMNFPSSVSTQNWSYRITKKELTSQLAQRLLKYNTKYQR